MEPIQTALAKTGISAAFEGKGILGENRRPSSGRSWLVPTGQS